MKKIVLLSVVILTSLLSSCSKDDNNEDSISLVGKSYAAYAYHDGGFYLGGVYIDPYDVYWVYRFVSDTEVEYSSRENSPNGKIIGTLKTCTYNLNYPDMTIYEDGHSTNATFINENTFRTGSDSNILEYTKQ